MITTGQHSDFVEHDCTVTLQGQSFTSGGAYLLCRKDTGLLEGILYHYAETHPDADGKPRWTNHFLGSWDGQQKAHCVRQNTWRSNFGDTRHSYFCIWNGHKLWGIQAGDSDIVRVREYKH